MTMRGKKFEKDIQIDGSSGSQHITGILYYMVGLRSKKKLNLTIYNPSSIPYIQLSIECLGLIGAKLRWVDDNQIQEAVRNTTTVTSQKQRSSNPRSSGGSLLSSSGVPYTWIVIL